MFHYRTLWIFCAFFHCAVFANTDYYCRDLIPQPSILIDQLMGIWYGIEIINHDSERHYVRHDQSCPIIHISEDRSQQSLYKDYNNYNYNYGSRTFDPYNNNPTTERGGIRPYNYPAYSPNQGMYPSSSQYPYHNDGNLQPIDPYRRTPPNTRERHHPYTARDSYQNINAYERDRLNKNYPDPYARTPPNYGSANYYPDRYPTTRLGRKFYDEVKRLRLLWDENGVSTEYRIRLNVSMPGFWISSGPNNGSSLDPQVGHFAGTIQVLKVVGNHLVLNFCHVQPDRRYFTAILSRSPSLSNYDISGVHGLLHRKGLDTNNIKKVCNGSIVNILNQILLFLSVGLFFFK